MKNFRKSFKYLVGITPLLFIFVLINILSSSMASDRKYFGVLLIYLIIMRIANLKSYVTFIFLLIILFIMSFRYFIAGPDEIAEKAAVWFVLFFAVGLVQKWRET